MAKSRRGSKFRGKNTDRADKCVKRDRDERGALPEREDSGPRSSLNDISWYSRNPALLAASAAFPYPYRPGMELPLVDWNTTKSHRNTTIPGVLALEWFPSIGNSSTSIDPASVTGKEFYGRVRAAFSGSLDADAPDFVVYAVALDSIFAYIGWLKRVYRTISTYTPENYLLPQGLMSGYGIGAQDTEFLRKHKVRLWQGINELILQSRKFRCPAVMDYFNRHYWMSDNVYADAPSARAQLYIFNLTGVYRLTMQQEVSSKEPVMGLALSLIPRTSVSGVDFVDQLINFGMDLISAMDAWDDGYLISGYLTRAFDGVPSFTVAELLQDELITAQYVPEVLSQIENARVVLPPEFSSLPTDVSTQVIVTQNVKTNAVVSNINLKYSNVQAANLKYINAMNALMNGSIRPMINLHSDAPTIAESVIATRLQAYTEYVTTASSLQCNITAGTEVPVVWRFVNYMADIDAYNVQNLWNLIPYGIDSADTTATPVYLTQMLAFFQLEQFDWHPIAYVLCNIFSNVESAACGDLYNPTVISQTDLANLHRICLFSEFNSFAI